MTDMVFLTLLFRRMKVEQILFFPVKEYASLFAVFWCHFSSAANFCIHSRHSCPTTDSTTFGNTLLKVMEDLRDLHKEELSATATSHS